MRRARASSATSSRPDAAYSRAHSFGMAVLAGISGPPEEQHREERRDRGQSARDSADVIPPHVQPGIGRRFRQPVSGRTIDEQIERVQLGVGRTGLVAVEVGFRRRLARGAPPPGCGPARAARRSDRTGSMPSGRPWRRPVPIRLAGDRSRACTCASGRRGRSG